MSAVNTNSESLRSSSDAVKTPSIEIIALDVPKAPLDGESAFGDLENLLCTKTVNAEQLEDVLKNLNEELERHGISTRQIIDLYEHLSYLSEGVRGAALSSDRIYTCDKLAPKAESLLTGYRKLLSLVSAPDVLPFPSLAESNLCNVPRSDETSITANDLNTNITDSESDRTGTQSELASEEVMALQAKLKSANETLSALRELNSQHETENIALSREVQSEKAQKAKLERDLTEADRLADALKADKQELVLSIGTLNDDLERLAKERDYLNGKLDEHTADEGINEEETSTKEPAETKYLSEQVASLEEKLARERENQAAEVADLNAALLESEKACKKLRKELAAKGNTKVLSENAALKQELTALRTEFAQTKADYLLLRGKHDSLQEKSNKERECSQKNINALEQRISELQKKTSSNPDNYQLMSQGLSDLERRYQQLKSERDELECRLIKEDAEKERPYIDAAKRMLKEARELKREMCALLEVPYKDDISITQLGEAMEYLKSKLPGYKPTHRPVFPRPVAPQVATPQPTTAQPSLVDQVEQKEVHIDTAADDSPEENETDTADRSRAEILSIASKFRGFVTPDTKGITPDDKKATELTQKLIEGSEINVKDTSILMGLVVMSFQKFRYTSSSINLEAHLVDISNRYPEVFAEAVRRLWRIESTKNEITKYSGIAPAPELAKKIWDVLDYSTIQKATRHKSKILFVTDLRQALRN